jgi:hypothetical protein
LKIVAGTTAGALGATPFALLAIALAFLVGAFALWR